MCIIAFSPVGEVFDLEEIKEMWNTNSDGAGIAVRNPKNGRIIFKKGIMKRKELIKMIKPFNKKEFELVIHCRITSRGTTNKLQTHPFKAGDIKLMSHLNIKGDLYFMNGTISQIKVDEGYNDTMTFIKAMQLENATVNQNLIDMIGDTTGAKWLCVSKEGIFYTSDFVKHNNKYYSNRNHDLYNYYVSKTCDSYEVSIENNYSKKLRKQIRKRGLYNELQDMIDNYCNEFICSYCFDCILDATNINEVEQLLKEHKVERKVAKWDE